MANQKISRLPIKFQGEGYDFGFYFNQVKERGNAYLYKVEENGTGKFIYDVFRKVIFEPENREVYPTTYSKGKWYWSFDSFEDAWNKFEEITRI